MPIMFLHFTLKRIDKLNLHCDRVYCAVLLAPVILLIACLTSSNDINVTRKHESVFLDIQLVRRGEKLSFIHCKPHKLLFIYLIFSISLIRG